MQELSGAFNTFWVLCQAKKLKCNRLKHSFILINSINMAALKVINISANIMYLIMDLKKKVGHCLTL